MNGRSHESKNCKICQEIDRLIWICVKFWSKWLMVLEIIISMISLPWWQCFSNTMKDHIINWTEKYMAGLQQNWIWTCYCTRGVWSMSSKTELFAEHHQNLGFILTTPIDIRLSWTWMMYNHLNSESPIPPHIHGQNHTFNFLRKNFQNDKGLILSHPIYVYIVCLILSSLVLFFIAHCKNTKCWRWSLSG